jgi:uncharacterized membrane protein
MERAHSRAVMYQFRWYRRSRLWVVPAAGVLMALVLAAVSLALDARLFGGGAPFPVFSGSVDTARQILVLIATAIATLTALVLTIVAVVIQLATQALSPRAVRTFLHDLHSHLTIGTFVTTFTYVLIVLEQLGLTRDGDDQVAGVSLTLAFALAVFSLGMFISYVDHIVHQARVSSIIDRIGNETRFMIEREYDDGHGTIAPQDAPRLPTSPDATVSSPTHGSVIEIDVAAIVATAARLDTCVVLIPAVGDFVPAGAPLFEVHGTDDGEALELLSYVEIDVERTIAQDVGFGLRLLVDIAERSLSPGINDPSTAVQVLDQLHDLLRRLGGKDFGTGWHGDDRGMPRLYVRQPTWDTFVALGLDEIRQYGIDAVQVVRRLRSLLDDLRASLPDERHPALRRQVRLLDDALDAVRTAGLDRAALAHPDRQGIGSTSAGFDAPGEADDRSVTVRS